MKKIIIILSIALILLASGCAKDNNKGNKQYSITPLQDYDASMCDGTSTIRGGYEGIGIKLEAYDSDSGQPIQGASGFINYQEQGGGSSINSEGFSCFITDPTFPFLLSVSASREYLQIKGLNITPVPVGKMYLIKVPMEKKPACYYDGEYLNNYFENINRSFGIPQSEYSLECMDSSFGRGGFIEAKGTYKNGEKLELLYHWGWCSSAGTDCGWTKCFAVEGNDELFQSVKKRLCNEIKSFFNNNIAACESANPSYDNTSEVREKCLEGEYEYELGDKKVISIIQSSGRCSSSVHKGDSNCLAIY